jgi:DnaJ-class molecular chaperone
VAWPHHPVAVCTACGKPLDIANADHIGDACPRPFCAGMFKSSRNSEDWERCKRCNGSGVRFFGRCRRCHGSGWHF